MNRSNPNKTRISQIQTRGKAQSTNLTNVLRTAGRILVRGVELVGSMLVSTASSPGMGTEGSSIRHS